MRLGTVAGALLFSIIVPASAEHDVPELTDDAQDVYLWLGSVNYAAPAIDLRAVWLDVVGDEVVVTWGLTNLSDHILPEPYLREGGSYNLAFENERIEFGLFSASFVFDRWRFSALVDERDGELRALEPQGLVDVARNRITVSASDGALWGLWQDVVASTLMTCSSLDENSASGGGNVWFRDSAPDIGEPRPHILVQRGAEPVVVGEAPGPDNVGLVVSGNVGCL